MKTIKVQNLTSSNGNDVPNQFEIRTEEGVYFQSYCTYFRLIDKLYLATLLIHFVIGM